MKFSNYTALITYLQAQTTNTKLITTLTIFQIHANKLPDGNHEYILTEYTIQETPNQC